MQASSMLWSNGGTSYCAGRKGAPVLQLISPLREPGGGILWDQGVEAWI